METAIEQYLEPTKKHRKVDPELMIKALTVIEGLTFPDIADSPEKKLSDIYKFAHIATGSCRNDHEDWHDELDKCEKALIKHGVIGKTY